MGKKRRLKSAKVKFAAKHKHHPRARFLAQMEQEAQEVSEPEIVQEAKTVPTIQEIEKSTPEVVLKEEEPKPVAKAKAASPKARKTTTHSKKKASTSRKRTTKKKTTSAVA